MAAARVIVLGGGLAGMAAALRLAEAHCEVELIEKRSVLGGRASSFVPPGEDSPIDNCQHVLLGCCTNLLDFFQRTGMADRFRLSNRFVFLGRGGASSVGAAALPAPLHLLPSLLRFRGLAWQDRWAIARAMLAILRSRQPPLDEPLLDWLRSLRQTPAAIENFWRVVLTSALNEDLEHLSTRPAFHVFLDAFLRNRKGYRMGVPTVPLSELYANDLLQKRCVLRLSTPVNGVKISNGRIESIGLQNGEERRADYYISALPLDALANLFSEEQRGLWPQMKSWDSLEWSPITGIHLWFDRPITRLDHAAVLGHTIQWVFNKSALAQSGKDHAGPQYVQLVVSASRALMTLRRDEILELSLRELEEVLPESKQARLQKAVVVKEAKATPSFPSGFDSHRPGPDTPFSNLFLAGDWTNTGWPPTMEGAVRSGYRAAERVTAASGNPQTFLQPDLPTAPLVRLLARF